MHRRFIGLPQGGIAMNRSIDSDRSERSARVLLFLAICAGVLWALATAPA
jgi:hypothetical protein